MSYAVRITAPYKKQSQAVAAQKRYGGEYDAKTKTWLYDERPHPAASQWGDILEIADGDTGIDSFEQADATIDGAR